jgi:sialate O-acetylesterase
MSAAVAQTCAAATGIWRACTPDSVKSFQPGCYFGVELEETKRSIGLINSSYGGSQAEAWTPVEYLVLADLKPTVDAQRFRTRKDQEVKVEN